MHRGMWNLPGGHVELGEHPTAAAMREVREETGVGVTLGGLIGVYSAISPNLQSIRFAFRAAGYDGVPAAGDEILEARWMLPADVLRKKDDELVGADILRKVLSDWRRTYPLEALREASYSS